MPVTLTPQQIRTPAADPDEKPQWIRTEISHIRWYTSVVLHLAHHNQVTIPSQHPD
ncbi:hypothetical protein BN12_530028 [Nostocoides japonicum T1-X7]|uniref:Uncharacterized protein n=1 Tax=Nostocoides japonicum T1-X7 TaxID=1194083 RepID=A0A077M6D0_9MICO|nr:hypothetical protein BN12_530028 [Tetrasphaera japonica T1-X7]